MPKKSTNGTNLDLSSLGSTEANIVRQIAASFGHVPLQNGPEEWNSLIHAESHTDAVVFMTRWFASLTFPQQVLVIERLSISMRQPLR